jgi:hypothetical protein
MISKLVRKARTLTEALHDFYREPLASFQALEKGLEDRRQPVPPELVSRALCAYQAAKRDQRSAGAEYQANGDTRRMKAVTKLVTRSDTPKFPPRHFRSNDFAF